jgi:hypothetical protein
MVDAEAVLVAKDHKDLTVAAAGDFQVLEEVVWVLQVQGLPVVQDYLLHFLEQVLYMVVVVAVV